MSFWKIKAIVQSEVPFKKKNLAKQNFNLGVLFVGKAINEPNLLDPLKKRFIFISFVKKFKNVDMNKAQLYKAFI